MSDTPKLLSDAELASFSTEADGLSDHDAEVISLLLRDLQRCRAWLRRLVSAYVDEGGVIIGEGGLLEEVRAALEESP